MASTTGGTLKTSKHQNKHQTMLKKQQQQQQQANNQYQVPFVGHCSPMAYAPPPPLFHQPPYLAAGSQHQHQQQQQLFSGAHTISRSKDLHKQYGQQATTKHGNMKNQALVYYDQPYLGFGPAATGGPPVPQPAPPMLPNGPYAAMSLAVRSPKERGPIPASLVNGMATIGPGSSRHYLAAPIDLYKPYNHHQHNLKTGKLIYQDPLSLLDQHARLNKPLCRCRVMYLGSSVPHITKNGLHGIQEPLRHLYPEEKFSTNSLRRRQQQQQQHPNQSVTIDISHLSSSLGIDSWLSVWSNGLLLENVDEFGREIKRFFSIESLHYCAAVRFFDTTTLMTEKQLNDSENQPAQSSSSSGGDPNNNNNNNDQMQDSMISANGDQSKRGVVRFLPLDAPIFQYPGMLDANHPPVFASIMRRTTGIKVLECHAFICRRDAASNALVRCCTHAYADFLSAKRMSAEFGEAAASANVNNSAHYNGDELHQQQQRHSRAASSMGRQHRHRADPTCDDQYLHQAGALVQPRLDGNNNTAKSIGKNNENNNNAVDPSSLTLSRRQDQVRTRRPARSLSTGGTNSQEMTHSDENSLEVDSEDNYAIILRQTTNDWPSNQQQQANSRLQPASAGSKQANNTNQTPKVMDSSTNRRKTKTSRERRSKGSSKSLFKGFMPHEQQLSLDENNKSRGQASSGGHDELNRLSHSLDHLQVAYGLEAPACCRLGPASKCANISNSHSSNTDDSDIKYSIVAGKQKRHSKSMQQLVQVSPTGSHHCQPHLMTMANEAEMVNSRECRASQRANSLTWTAGRQRRKAASCQDILAGQHHHHHHSAGGSLSRGSSCSGRRRNRPHKGRPDSHRSSMSSLHQNSLAGSQMRLDTGAGGQHQHHQRARQLSQQHDANNYIYASCDDHAAVEPPEAQSLRVFRADCCVQPPQGGRAATASTAKQLSDSHVSSSSSSSVKAKKTSSKRRSSDQKQRLDQDQQQQLQPAPPTSSAGDPLGYYQFLQPPPPPPPLSLSRADCCSPNGLLMGPNSHQAAMYGLPPHLQGAYYLNQRHSQAGSQLYESPAYLMPAPGPGPMYLSAAAQLAHGPRVVSSDQYHPMFHQHQHPGSATMSHRHPLTAGPLYNGAPVSMMAMNGSSMTMAQVDHHKSQSARHKSHDSKRDSKLSKKSHTLATRFRCLSPPLNFLSNDRSSAASRSGQHPMAGQSHEVLIDQPLSSDRIESPDQNNNNNSYGQNKCADNRQSSASASSATTSASTGERISPSDIVSGRPGFLATGSNGHHSQQEPAKQATPVQKREARPKLSWIKRLSLSLSGGSPSSSSHIRHQPDGSKQSSANLLNCPSELGSPQAAIDDGHNNSEAQPSGSTLGPAEERPDNKRQASGLSEGHLAPPSEESYKEENNRPSGEPEQEQPGDDVITEPKEQQQQEQLKTKTKAARKKGGLFSGTLTLGRKSRANKTK